MNKSIFDFFIIIFWPLRSECQTLVSTCLLALGFHPDSTFSAEKNGKKERNEGVKRERGERQRKTEKGKEGKISELNNFLWVTSCLSGSCGSTQKSEKEKNKGAGRKSHLSV